MDTLTAIRNGEIVTPVPIQVMFGGCSIDPEALEIFEPQPRRDESELDEELDARCASL